MRWWLLVVTLASACVQSDSVHCGDRTCPQGSKCDDVHSLCVSHDQASACGQLVDGDRCEAMDIAATGVCDQGYCVPGCGDGVTQDPNALGLAEECDDGNFQSHDGCSSVCTTETPVWLEIPRQWQGRYAHVAAYMNALDKHVLFGGVDLLRGKPGDLWERDADGKWTQTSNVSVAPRIGGVMAYDSARGKLVVFGGLDENNALGTDTWEYDGTTWTNVNAVNPPPGRSFAGMVFDSTRNKMILFGGQLAGAIMTAETWEYDGPTSTWTKIATTGAIPGRRQHGLAYDGGRQRVVVFGGVGQTGVLSDTWDYNPATATWTANATATHPSGRFGVAMTYQASRSRTVLFGGEVFINQAIAYADQWEYDGATWTEYTTTVRPPGRYSAVLTTAANGALALIGGATGAELTPLDDVWGFSSIGVWRDVSPEFPPPREAPMTYDRKHEQLIMFAGDFAANSADTWAFDGLRWADLTPTTTTNPPWRQFHATAYDSKRDRVIVFGGERGSPRVRIGDTWEWSGETKTWSQFMGTAPAARDEASLAYDETIGATVLFGGADLPTTFNDTWEFDGTAWTQQTQAGGPPARANRATMAYDPVHERTVLFDTDGKTWIYVDHTWSLLATTDDPPAQDHVNLTFDADRHVLTLFGTNSRVWELDGDHWHRVLTVGTVPGFRYNPAFAGHTKARRLVMFGGVAAGGVIGDSWLFGYRSGLEVPDEICDDGTDNDSDKHVDAADPDCENQ